MKKLFEQRDVEDYHKYRALFEGDFDGNKTYFVLEKDSDFRFGYGEGGAMYWHITIPNVIEEFIQKDGIENYFSQGSQKFVESLIKRYKKQIDKLDPPKKNEIYSKLKYAYDRYRLTEQRHAFYKTGGVDE